MQVISIAQTWLGRVSTRPSISSEPLVMLSPRDHPQERRLPAAREADEDDELAVRDVDVDALDDPDRSVALANDLQPQCRHVPISPPCPAE
jgi:hypothetical protein